MEEFVPEGNISEEENRILAFLSARTGIVPLPEDKVSEKEVSEVKCVSEGEGSVPFPGANVPTVLPGVNLSIESESQSEGDEVDWCEEGSDSEDEEDGEDVPMSRPAL